MKRTIKLVVLAGALLAAAAMAAPSHKSSEFNFLFPQYAAIYTNVTQVNFFDSATGTEGALKAVGGYYASTKTALLQCMDDSANLPDNYTINGSSTTANLYCSFVPNAITKDQGFSVSGYQGAADPDTDGELLIITNASNFATNVSVSGSITDASIEVIPGYVKSDGSVAGAGDTTAQDVSSAGFVQSQAYDTQYASAKVIPLLFYAQVDVLNVSEITTAETMTVTWGMASP